MKIMNDEDVRIIGDEKLVYKYIVYTADGTEFHLQDFDEFNASGKIGKDYIKFHPEHIVAIRTIRDESYKD